MNLPADLKFKNEDERIATIEQYEAEGGSDVSELERIAQAPVEVPDEVSPEEVVEEIEEPSVPNSEATEVPAKTPVPEAPAQPTSEDTKRSWTITEDDIPKDTYFDKNEGKVRPFITQKNFGDLTKSYISGQKRIHYLEDILLPQERAAAQAQATAEIERLKGEIAQLKAVPAPQQPSQPTPSVPVKPVASGTPAVSIDDARTELKTALDELKAVDPSDAIDHTDKLHRALVASMNHSNSLTDHIGQLQKSTQTVDSRFQQIEDARKADEEARRLEEKRRNEETQRNQATENWRKACQLVDAFAQTSPEFKEEFGQLDQSFEGMANDAMDFHISLAGLMYNKHPQQATKQEIDAATQAYLGGNEQLKMKAAQYGLDEPKNYRAWLELDQVDAMRTGFYRDPISKQWIQTTDPVSKQPVMLGDMNTAYSRYLDVSGKRNQKVQAMLKNQQESLTGAIARRDTGIVSMDTNRLHGDGSGADMTEQQAVEIMESMDDSTVMSEYLRTGDRTKLELLNRALARLGAEALEIPDLTDAIPKAAEQ